MNFEGEMLTGICLVTEAAGFAARRHTGMARKGRGNEPYVNHLAEVAHLLAVATDGADAELVAAGWLHDTIEDTETTREELAEEFGARVADIVVEVTDDMSLPKDQRRQKQIEDAAHKSPDAKLVKIADKISNVSARVLPHPSETDRGDLFAKRRRLMTDWSLFLASQPAEVVEHHGAVAAHRRRP